MLECEYRLQLFDLVADMYGPNAALPLSREIRAISIRTGSARMMASLHLRLARVEAISGSLGNAKNHLASSRRLLETEPSGRLSAVAAVHSCVFGLMESDFDRAIAEGNLALEISAVSGHAQSLQAAANNLCRTYLNMGEPEQARRFADLALAQAPSGGLLELFARESLANVFLATGQLDQCGSVLTALVSDLAKCQGEGSWHGLNIVHTWSKDLLRVGRLQEAGSALDEGLSLAEGRGDRFWQPRLRLLKAELAVRVGHADRAVDTIESISVVPDRSGLALYGDAERVRAGIHLAQGRPGLAVRHGERAVRIADVLGDVRQKTAADHDLEAARRARDAAPAARIDPPADDYALGLATVFDFAGYPELVGHEALGILRDAGCAAGAALAASRDGAAPAVLARLGWDDDDARDAAARPGNRPAIPLGERRGRRFVLVVEPRPDLASRAFVSALRRLIGSAIALDGYRRDERQRASLWPPEDDQDAAGEVFRSAEMIDILATARRIAPTELPVLLTGETGTGKEVLARAIHRASPRAARPFLAFNCSAVPRELLESQLFGHRRGAFTGALDAFPGVIRAAAGGTLFLDEIGELGPDTQPKLLRFLETREVHPIGEPRPVQVDVRIVAATNADLDRLVTEGRFREDLLYRLNVIRFRLPPLRERREEIPPLVTHFLARAAAELGKGRVRVSDETMEYLLLFAWPGNVRQLANEIRRAVALADADATIEPAHLSDEIRASRRTIAADAPPRDDQLVVPLDAPLATVLETVERAMIARALDRTHDHYQEAARRLGISRKGLFLKRRRWGLQPPSPPAF